MTFKYEIMDALNKRGFDYTLEDNTLVVGNVKVEFKLKYLAYKDAKYYVVSKIFIHNIDVTDRYVHISILKEKNLPWYFLAVSDGSRTLYKELKLIEEPNVS